MRKGVRSAHENTPHCAQADLRTIHQAPARYAVSRLRRNGRLFYPDLHRPLPRRRRSGATMHQPHLSLAFLHSHDVKEAIPTLRALLALLPALVALAYGCMSGQNHKRHHVKPAPSINGEALSHPSPSSCSWRGPLWEKAKSRR